MMGSLRHLAFYEQDPTYKTENRMIEQYSSSYTDEDAEMILGRVTSNDPKLRLIITTIALGMGVDMKDVVNIFHWGVPDNVLQYWQEIGRGGRSGKPATAVLFAYGPSMRNIQKSMKDMIGEVKEQKCVRRAVLSRLRLVEDGTVDLPLNPRCCSVCSS